MIKRILKEIVNVFLFLLTIIVSAPFLLIAIIVTLLKRLIDYIAYKHICNKKFNEKKIKRKLYNRLKQILYVKREIKICKEFWIPFEEYEYYITLKYIFTENKKSFIYRKGSDKYLYNFYDMNAYKEGFIEKWIEEIKNMFSLEESVKIEDITIPSPIDNAKSRDVVRVSIE